MIRSRGKSKTQCPWEINTISNDTGASANRHEAPPGDRHWHLPYWRLCWSLMGIGFCYNGLSQPMDVTSSSHLVWFARRFHGNIGIIKSLYSSQLEGYDISYMEYSKILDIQAGRAPVTIVVILRNITCRNSHNLSHHTCIQIKFSQALPCWRNAK